MLSLPCLQSSSLPLLAHLTPALGCSWLLELTLESETLPLQGWPPIMPSFILPFRILQYFLFGPSIPSPLNIDRFSSLSFKNSWGPAYSSLPYNTPILPLIKPDVSYRLIQDLRISSAAVTLIHPVVPNPYTLLSHIPAVPTSLFWTSKMPSSLSLCTLIPTTCLPSPRRTRILEWALSCLGQFFLRDLRIVPTFWGRPWHGIYLP